MQEYIRRRAANIQRRIGDLLREYGYTPSGVPGSGELIALEEIILAIAEHEAAAWQPLSRKPGDGDSIILALSYNDRHRPSEPATAWHAPGLYTDGTWRILQASISRIGAMEYRTPQAQWHIIAWRRWPSYVAPAVEE